MLELKCCRRRAAGAPAAVLLLVPLLLAPLARARPAEEFGRASTDVSWGSVVQDNKEQEGERVIKEPASLKPLRCPAGYYRGTHLIWPCGPASGEAEVAESCRFSIMPTSNYVAVWAPKGLEQLTVLTWNNAQMELQIGTDSEPRLIGVDGDIDTVRRIGVVPALNVTANYSGPVGLERVDFKGITGAPMNIAFENIVGNKKDARIDVLVKYRQLHHCDAGAPPQGCRPYSEAQAREEVARWCCSGAWNAEDAWSLLGEMHAELHGAELAVPWFMFGPMWQSFSALTAATKDNWMFAFEFIDTNNDMAISESEFKAAFSVCGGTGDAFYSHWPSWGKMLGVMGLLALSLATLAVGLYVCAVTSHDMVVAGTAPEGTQLPTWASQRKPLARSKEDVEVALWAAHMEAGQKYSPDQVEPLVQKSLAPPPQAQRVCGTAGASWLTDWFDCGGRGSKEAAAKAGATAPAAFVPMGSVGQPPVVAAVHTESRGPAETSPLLAHEDTAEDQRGAADQAAAWPAAASPAPAPATLADPDQEAHDLTLKLLHASGEREQSAAAEALAKRLAAQPPGAEARSAALQAVLQVMDGRPRCGPLHGACCRALATLSQDAEDDDSASREAIQRGAVSAVVASMAAHEQDKHVQEAGVMALKEFAYSADGRDTICRQGGVRALYSAMRHHTSDELIQEHACNTLGNVSISEVAVEALGPHVFAEVVKVMTAHPKCERVLEAGICALYNIDYALQDDQLLAAAGVRAAVRKAVDAFPNLGDEEEAQGLLAEE